MLLKINMSGLHGVLIVSDEYSPIKAPRLKGVNFCRTMELVGLLPSKICCEHITSMDSDALMHNV